ncbi:SGNH hydrolase-type esterase superfamily protein [Actinidia rufa]|uniref:SGNH hydrolase-type esterase superfamily protein n=1 Tax=Actinidia rufa TaxID=165716 RepID=A0A7J0EWJ6_9ERIC|nr:SGNH hydrolase-type esterase superfamily protein [Actinidia rufa]
MAMQGLALAVLVIINMVAVALSASLVTFIFGDSLTEVGNNNFLQYSLAKSNFPYYGIDYPGGQATGRFTNGRTIGDIISAKLGIPSPPAYLSLSPTADAILKGVNYASGGAGILNNTGLYFIQRLSFDDQVSNFEKTKEAINTKIGGEAAEKLCNEAMYFIGIGSNDYVNNFLQPFLADGQQYTHDEFVGLLTATLEQHLVASRSRIPLVAKLTPVLEGYAYLTQSCAATELSTFFGMRFILRMQQTQFLQKNSSPASFPILLLLHQYPLIEQFQHQLGSISLDLTRSERVPRSILVPNLD